jgi:glyoxylase-like metal-dependent hydrolase (beta-lactamase superfamily II)
LTIEVVPGVYRIQSDLGSRFMCQYVLAGEERTLLVDTGISRTPVDVIEPYLNGIGLGLEAIDDVVVSHADVDHCGGDRLLRARAPQARFSCPEADRRWIESNEAMMAENYCWHEPYGFAPIDDESRRWITTELGGDCPVDVGLHGGETMRLAPDWRVEIVHLPGHTPGHLGVWDDRSRAAIIIDAVLYDGIYDRAGNRLIPPRYYDAAAYRATIHRLLSLRPAVLLTAHYDVMEGADALEWLEQSLSYTDELNDTVREGLRIGVTDLWQLTQYADERLGPYPEFMTELGASVRAHMNTPGIPAA